MRTRRSYTLFAVALAALSFALPASPAPVTFDFTVRVTAATNVPGASVGSLLTGSYTFESTTPHDSPETNVGSWGSARRRYV